MTDHIWHPFTKFSSLGGAPLPEITGGKGIYLIDSEGRRYVDAISSWWCVNLGHGQPEIVEAIRVQSERLQHSILGNLSNAPSRRLAERLCRLMPSPERHVMFSSDGSCAVDAALKAAAQYHFNTGHPERNTFLALEQGYHGDTIGAVSVGYVDDFHKPFAPLLRRSHTVGLPDYDNGEGFAPTKRMIDAHADTLAAIIVEPLCQGAAGMRMYPAEYLKDLYDYTRPRGILMIVDEIAMGFGRTGSYFAFNQAGIDPDIVCIGKGVTGGYLPLSAMIAKDYVYETFTDKPHDHTFYHGHTFGGNPIAAAAALTALELYEKLDIPARSKRLGEKMRARLDELHGVSGVKDIRHLGLIGVVELEPSENSAMRADRIREGLKERGVLLRPLGDVFYIMPPLIINKSELDDLCGRFIASIMENI